MACLEAMQLGWSYSVPSRLWFQSMGVYDPYELILPAEARKHFSLSTLSLFLLGRRVDEEELWKDPFSQAILAKNLIKQVQLDK